MFNFTIHRKLFISYILLSIVPLIVLGSYMSASMKSATIERALSDTSQNVENIAAFCGQSLKVLDSVSDQIYLNPSIARIVSKQYASSWDAVSDYFMFRDFEGIQKVYGNQIESIRIYVRNDTILESWYLYKITDEDKMSTWYQRTTANPLRKFWCPTVDQRAFRNQNRYSLARLLRSGETEYYALIDFNMAYLSGILKSEYFSTVIFDEQGYVIGTSDDGFAAHTAKQYSFDAYESSDKVRVLDGSSEEGNYKVIMKDIEIDGASGRFRIVSSFLLRDILHESDMLFRRYILLTVGLGLLASVLMVMFSHNLRHRVSMLQREMVQVGAGEFTLVSSVKGADELGVLAKSLNVMAHNLKVMEAQNIESNRQQQRLLEKHNDIKLKQLANQMNPHFLFNTLESLRMEARIHNELEIADIIRRLGALLRKSIHTGRDELPIEEEIALVEDYLCIQAFRYGERIRYKIAISEDARQLRILPFLIQPLVENAIIHGLENCERPGLIRINATCDDDSLTIRVIDNGVGFTPERLREMTQSLNDEAASDEHIGIRNVHLRAQLRYGAPYGLRIDSRPKCYTKITLRLPKVVK